VAAAFPSLPFAANAGFVGELVLQSNCQRHDKVSVAREIDSPVGEIRPSRVDRNIVEEGELPDSKGSSSTECRLKLPKKQVDHNGHSPPYQAFRGRVCCTGGRSRTK
jgi:hypothetical protein